MSWSSRVRSRFDYGWIVVVASSLVMLTSYGMYVTYGLFMNPLAEEFGWSRAAISGAYTLSSVIQGIVGILAGVWTDKLGARVVVTISGVLFGSGYILMSWAESIWGLYLFFGVLTGIGLSGLWVPPLSTVARWFTRRRSLATGIVLSGMTIGQIVAPPIISRLIIAFGWRSSFLIPGIVALVVIVAGAQALRKEPRVQQSVASKDDIEVGKQVPGLTSWEAVRSRQFWIVSAAFFSVGIAAFGPLIHLVPYAVGAGLSEVSAANLLAVHGAVGIPGSFLLGGLLGDSIGNRKTFMVGLTLVVVSLLLLVSARQVWLFYLCAVVLGTGMSCMATAESPLVAEIFGLSRHASIYAAVGIGYTAGVGLGPLLFGSIFDGVGSYSPAFFLSTALGVIALVLITVLRPSRRLTH